MSFTPPSLEEAMMAIGRTEDVPEGMKAALDPGRDFDLIPSPGQGDWLAEHPEKGQTFDAFLTTVPKGPERGRNRIYLQPLGEFPDDRGPSLKALREYAETFFQMEIILLPPKDIWGGKVRTRINPFIDRLQIQTGDILRMLKRALPGDAYCILGITMQDLYPGPLWNFVYGQTSLKYRVGVFSLARYDPVFYGKKRGKDYDRLILRRGCKVMAHETAHILFLKHCIFFRCLMNGSNHLEESDERPLRLCPVCLRKLQHVSGFDVRERYEGLLKFYKEYGFSDEKKWLKKRLKRIGRD